MMKFLCDAMLGRLANWLRLLGYDTVYANTTDHELVRQARSEGRILLTRDIELARRRGIDAVFISSNHLKEQLQQVIEELALQPDRVLSRCPTCNTPLRSVTKAEVRERVPAYVFRKHTSFRECPECGKIYWRGSHWQKMQDYLQELGVQPASEGREDAEKPA